MVAPPSPAVPAAAVPADAVPAAAVPADAVPADAGPPRGVAAYSPEAKRAERERRARVRAEWLDRLPHPDVTELVEAGGDRPQLWPPSPSRPPQDGWRGTTFTREELLERLATFAESRGPDFTMHEFLRWARMSERPFWRQFGGWTAARLAAGLPQHVRRRDLKLRTLHKLLRAVHINQPRTLTAAQLCRVSGVRPPTLAGYGGLARIQNLYKLWVHPNTRRVGPAPVTDDAGERIS